MSPTCYWLSLVFFVLLLALIPDSLQTQRPPLLLIIVAACLVDGPGLAFQLTFHLLQADYFEMTLVTLILFILILLRSLQHSKFVLIYKHLYFRFSSNVHLSGEICFSHSVFYLSQCFVRLLCLELRSLQITIHGIRTLIILVAMRLKGEEG